MKVSNEVYKIVKIDWDNITLPLKEGSPISADGVVANDARAIGLLPTAIKKRPLMDTVYILVGGDVIISDVEKAFGESLSTEAIANMGGIRFYSEDGVLGAPWQKNGRWYKVVIESDGTESATWVINHEESDEIFKDSVATYATIALDGLLYPSFEKFPPGTFITDVKPVLNGVVSRGHFITYNGSGFMEAVAYASSVGPLSVNIGPAYSFAGKIELYLFITFPD